MNPPSRSQSRSDFWLEQVNAAEASGVSSAQFCQEKDLNYSQFMYWRQKFQKPSVSAPATKACGFVKAESSLIHSASGLSVSLPNGIQIHGIDSANLILVRSLLEWAS